MEGINAKVVDSKLAELEGEAATHMTAMCPVYAMIILEHARYRQPHEDMLFFEALYKVQQLTSTVIMKMSERCKITDLNMRICVQHWCTLTVV